MTSVLTRAARFVDRDSEPMVLGYHPVARVNPFQALLYSQAQNAGVAPVGIVELRDLEALELLPAMGVKSLLHLHWTAGITAGADEREARGRAEEFLRKLRGLKARGVGSIWTIHNVLPHNCDFPDVEKWFRSSLVDVVDVVHVMNDRTTDEVNDLYPLPTEKVLSVPHPSYHGAYPTHHSPETVRFEMGFEASDFVVGMMGSIQPYKGIDHFLRSLRKAVTVDPSLRGLVAGVPGSDLPSKQLVLDILSDDLVTAVPRRLTDAEMARVVTALDVAVLPYRASLNSGAALLAVTFGIPIVGPVLGHFRELEEAGLCLTYDPEDEESLSQTLVGIRDWVQRYDKAAAARYMEDRAAERVSTEFFAGVRDLLS